MNSKWKAALALLLVFIAGGVFGVEGTRIAVRHAIGRAINNPELVQQRVELNLARRLRLDPMQRRQLQQILFQSRQQLQQLRAETQPRFIGIISNAETQVQAMLRPAQQRQFQLLKEENRRLLPLGPAPLPFQRPAAQRATNP